MSPTPLVDRLGDPVGEALVEPDPRQALDDDEPPPRQCGRCRLMFQGDPTLYAPAQPDWWVCPPCRAALFGRDGRLGRDGRRRTVDPS